jgi:[ribosomal protein S18]-alanine N-acetyltransferase
MTLEDCAVLAPLFAEIPGGIEPSHELGRELTRAWVISENETSGALGFALGWWLVDELEIVALGVAASARRRGLAGALLAEVVAAARAAGARRVLLEVAASNTAARRLYESAGFSVFNVRRGYYRQSGDDALELELGL